MFTVYKHAGLDDKLIVLPQRCHLSSHDVRMAGHAEVVIAIKADRIGPRGPAMQDEAPANLLVPAWLEIPLNTLQQMPGQSRIAATFGYNFAENAFVEMGLHGVPCEKVPPLKMKLQNFQLAPLSMLTGVTHKKYCKAL